MRIGIDFDNTLACYHQVFGQIAREQGIVSKGWKGGKTELRSQLRSYPEGELLWQVLLPETSTKMVGEYQKLRVRDSWDFPEAGIASAWIPGDVTSVKVASTALESIPRLHSELVEGHIDANNGAIDVALFSDEMYKDIKPVNNTALPPRYRRSMIRTLTKRSLQHTVGGKK